MVQPVHWDRVDGADHLQHAVEVVELLEHLQDLDDPRQHGHPLLQIHGLHDTPESARACARLHVELDFLVKEVFDLLLKPQREVGGVADHAEQVWRVLLFVLFGPDTADQLGRPHGSGVGGVSETFESDRGRTGRSLQL